MTTIYNIYDQVAEMIANLEPEMVLSLKISEDMQKRFDDLKRKLNSSELNSREKDELDHFIVLERLFRLAKIKADIQLNKE